MQCVKRSQIYT
ncbi:MAG: hypothetical protein QG673_858, partial [Pseudomonadota bacterium]|nr:hypothetical protein [Pseudomonadota bacterium]